MASLDIYRPAAQTQLEILGRENNIDSLAIVTDEKPLAIARRAIEKGKLEGYDIVLLDTAGRLHIDDELMEELTIIRDAVKPAETLLVADAMTGQDAVTIADTFNKRVGVTGIMLTRVDGDARGGAALSMRAVTGCPIKLLGVGEHIDELEEFQPDRIADRILDMGDVVALVEKAAETIDQQDAEQLAKKIQSGTFDLNDLASQLKQMQKLGGMSGILKMLPGFGKFKEQLGKAGADDSIIKHQMAIINSMNKQERKYIKVLNASRKRRIAEGSGTSVQSINRLLKQYQQMSKMMKRAGKLGKKGLGRHGLSGLFPQ